MVDCTDSARDDCVLILAPKGRDAQLSATILRNAGLNSVICPDVAQLCEEIDAGAGAAVITEETLTFRTLGLLMDVLNRQPKWSDFPILVFCGAPKDVEHSRPVEHLSRTANVTLLDRPIHVHTMVSAVAAALRARSRQYATRDLMQQLQHRIRERDQFLAVLGHELRNPLAAILLASESMAAEPPEAAAQHRGIIERQTRHLARLVDDLLDVARVTSGKIVVQKHPLDLREIVLRCLENLRATTAHHIIDTGISDQPLIVDADPVRLEQIIGNLITNAVKYSAEGRTIVVKADIEDDQVVIRVKDDGVGIDGASLGRIFDMFTQVEQTIDRAQGGLGLGLMLVQSLTELHGGSVEALSDGPGSGSEFIVRLPRSASVALIAQPPEAKDDSPGIERRVVVVEDNRDVRDLLRIMLRRLGHQVETAADGTEGLEKIRDGRPDAAVVDLGLPGIDGYEVARRTRRDLGADILLIALSGYGQPEDRKRATDAGFDVHITKPANIDQLRRALNEKRPSEDESQVEAREA